MREEFFVYVIAEVDGEHLKVGWGKCVARRMRSLQTGNPRRLFIAYTAQFASRQDAARVERAAHAVLRRQRRNGEWFACRLGEATQAINRACRVEGIAPDARNRLGEGERSVLRAEGIR